MLMIGTSALAERLYDAWRARQDVLRPLDDDADEEGWRSAGFPRRTYWHGRRSRPRPRWSLLTGQQQDVWKHVADTARRVMADAMGALP